MTVAEALQNKKHYTYADYITWDDKYRCELIDGEAFVLYLPDVKHQRILKKLSTMIDAYFSDKPYELFIAPFDVKFSDDNVVQPDLFVISDLSCLDEKSYNGTPDLVIEIVISDTANKDLLQKFRLYKKVGVKEFWMVDSRVNAVFIFTRIGSGQYIQSDYGTTQLLSSEYFKGLTINLNEIFEPVEAEDTNKTEE